MKLEEILKMNGPGAFANEIVRNRNALIEVLERLDRIEETVTSPAEATVIEPEEKPDLEDPVKTVVDTPRRKRGRPRKESV